MRIVHVFGVSGACLVKNGSCFCDATSPAAEPLGSLLTRGSARSGTTVWNVSVPRSREIQRNPTLDVERQRITLTRGSARSDARRVECQRTTLMRDSTRSGTTVWNVSVPRARGIQRDPTHDVERQPPRQQGAERLCRRAS